MTIIQENLNNDESSIESMVARVRMAAPYATEEELFELATRLCDGDTGMAHLVLTAAKMMDDWSEKDTNIPSNG